MFPPASVARFVLILGAVVVTTTAAVTDEPPLEHRFEQVVHPFLKSHCLACHGPEKPKDPGSSRHPLFRLEVGIQGLDRQREFDTFVHWWHDDHSVRVVSRSFRHEFH
jgi:hypothetical protein